METHMLRSNFLDDPIMQPAEAIRIPRFTCAWRWEQIRICRMAFVLLYEKLYQNAMLALFLRSKKSLKRSLILVPSRRKIQFFVSYNT